MATRSQLSWLIVLGGATLAVAAMVRPSSQDVPSVPAQPEAALEFLDRAQSEYEKDALQQPCLCALAATTGRRNSLPESIEQTCSSVAPERMKSPMTS